MSETKKIKAGAVIAVKEPRAVVAQGNPDSPESLIAMALREKADVGTMERLLAMRKELKEEAAREAFNTDMAAFQAACPIIKKTKGVKTKAGAVAYKYAPIESIITQVKSLIEKHGFRYSTVMEFIRRGDETTVKAVCRVVHRLGYFEETPMEVPLGAKTDIMSQSQVVAAAQTFAKRYAFLNAFGIMTGDDDSDAAKSPEETSSGNLAQLLKLVKTADAKALMEFTTKIEKSSKYTEEQKKQFHEAAQERLNILNSKKNGA